MYERVGVNNACFDMIVRPGPDSGTNMGQNQSVVTFKA